MTDTTSDEKSPSSQPTSHRFFILVVLVYLLGIFIGALDTGIVTPGRTVIQNELGVSDQLGIWIITIYTLAYAASIPVMGKLADRHGRKPIYLFSVALFGIGSLFCGLSQQFGNFYVLLGARAIQALGGGGIMPVATAEFGTTFPPEKRGMALGLVGGVYGVANVLGASAGSAILDIFGTGNWPYIFYLNLPICLFIVAVGIFCLPNTRKPVEQRIDGLGICVLTVMTLSLMYGLKNIDFFNIATSIRGTDVYPFLIASIAALPLFILIERHASDPVINLSYFRNRDIVITLIISIITGVVLMGIVFIPQFSENALRLKSGDGGYMVVILALFSGIGAPLSGKLIDRYGVKVVLGGGLLLSAAGALYLAFVTCAHPTWFNVILCLVVMGTGMGFTMGTPINYMMLAKTELKESNSALATLSLVRSIGTAVAPAIMVAFIAHAGTLVQDRVMDIMPTEVTVSPLPYAQELDAEFTKLQADPDTADMLAGVDIPDLESMQTIEIDMNTTDGSYEIPDDIQALLEDSDVTTITENTKTMASTMFDEMSPDLIADVTDGIDQGKASMTTARTDMDANLVDMQAAVDEMNTGIDGMNSAIDQQEEALAQMQEYLPMLEKVENYSSVLDFIPDDAKASMPTEVLDELADVRTSADLQAKIDELSSAMDTLNGKIADMQTAQAGIAAGIEQMKPALAGMQAQIAADQASLATETDPVRRAQLEGQIAGEQQAASQMSDQIASMQAQSDSLTSAMAQMSAAVQAQQQAKSMMEEYLPTLRKFDSYSSVVDLMPDDAKASMPSDVLDQLSEVKTVADLEGKMAELQSAIDQVTAARDDLIEARDELLTGMQGVRDGQAELDTTLSQLSTLEDAVPGSFEEARQNYLREIDDRSDQIEGVFQTTLDEGFKGMFILLAICSAVGFVLLLFYREDD